MKLYIEQSDCYKETEIIIHCSILDRNLQKIIEQIQLASCILTVQKDDQTLLLKPDTVCYLESVDDKTFVYTEKEVYESQMKLYELEEFLKQASFVRISKSCILNINYLESVRPLLNGKMEALLSNGERIIVNRHYVPEFKRKFGL
ncbi:MAG: LytTR family DNA-binding domain-containing protein [Acutalibacteraceae bacterium]